MTLIVVSARDRPVGRLDPRADQRADRLRCGTTAGRSRRSSRCCSSWAGCCGRSTACSSPGSGCRRWPSRSARSASTAAWPTSCWATRRSPTSRQTYLNCGQGIVRRDADPEPDDPVRRPRRDLRRRPAPHRRRPLDLRHRRQRGGRPVRRAARQAGQVLAVRRLRRGLGPRRRRLHAALRVSARGDNGTGLELSVVACVLLGGVSTSAAAGTCSAVIVAVFLLGALRNVLTLNNVSSDALTDRHRRPAAALRARAERHGARARGRAARSRHHHHYPRSINTPVRRDMSISKFAHLAPACLRAGGRRRAARPRQHRRRHSSSSAAAPADHRPAPKSASGKLTIAFLPKQLNNPYFTISDNGGKKAVDGAGGHVQAGRPVGPTASARSPTSTR